MGKVQPEPWWLQQVLDHYGLGYKDQDWEQSIRCPLGTHEDRHPSASANLGRGVWMCYTCGIGGDAVTIVELRENVEISEALKRTDRIVAGGSRPVSAGDDTGGGFMVDRSRNQQRDGGWRFSWGSSE